MQVSDDLIGVIIQEARSRRLMIATAESCTGGMVAARLTDIPGASDVVDCGFVAYSNEAKVRMLGVPKQVLAKYGAVSPETAASMAQGAIRHSAARLSVAVSGIAGPGGGSESKPVGHIVFATAFDRNGEGVDLKTVVERFDPALSRSEIRLQAMGFAVSQLALALGLVTDLTEGNC